MDLQKCVVLEDCVVELEIRDSSSFISSVVNLVELRCTPTPGLPMTSFLVSTELHRKLGYIAARVS